MIQGNIVQQMAQVLFYIEISLYVILILAGITGLVIFVNRWTSIQKAKGDPSQWIGILSKDLDSGILPDIDNKKINEKKLPDRMIKTGLHNAGLAPEALEKVFEVQESMERRTLSSGVSFLGTVGANAPFVGLAGTVLGVLIAFNEFARTGGQGSSEVMVAIARSLIATALGLLVAIPAVIGFNILKSRIKKQIDTTKEIRGLILARAVHAVSQSVNNDRENIVTATTCSSVSGGV